MSQREALLGVSTAEFRDLAASRCKVQEPDQRFGDNASETIQAREAILENPIFTYYNEESSSESDDPDDETTPPRGAARSRRKPPKLQNWRMNLTALSQAYNLYFAAYGNKIWVYCPVGPMSQGLGGRPALIINHTVTHAGSHISSRIDRRHPDYANHMMVGFLGDVEILLLCYDNGDVAAYHTRDIATHIAHHAHHPDSAPRPHPRPFLSANVGISAWGLAIHAKSRLIAVSSNKAEVTVFAFALTRAPPPSRFLAAPYSAYEAAVLARKRNWRIVLPLKPNGDNIPNIDFVSSAGGHAQKVSAVDINGHIWLLDIWRQETAPALIVPQDTTWRSTYAKSFWGVLALPASSFLDLGTKRHNSSKQYFSGEASRTRAIALGKGNIPLQLPFRQSRYWIDTTSALELIQDSKFSGAKDYHLTNPMDLSMLTGNPPLLSPGASDEEEEEEAEESSEGEDDGDESNDDDGDGDVNSENQLDNDYNDSDEDEDEADLEVEISSWGDSEEELEANDAPLYHYTSLNGINPGPPPPFLESHLPNDVDLPHGLNGVPINGVPQLTDAQKGLGIAFRRTAPGLINRLPQDATEQRPEYVDGKPVPRMGMVYIPHKGMTYREPASDRAWLNWLKRRRESSRAEKEQDHDEIAALGEHMSLFVTDDMDLRLLTTSRRFVDIYCRDPAGVRLPQPFYAGFCRVNMTLLVPELNLVVAANQSGRVALISLVRSAWAVPTLCGDRSMRVDKILPTASEEAVGRVRPDMPLFGVAVGPVQEVDDASLRLRGGRRRPEFSCLYRLVLHFRDHTILSYVISRPSPDDLLVI